MQPFSHFSKSDNSAHGPGIWCVAWPGSPQAAPVLRIRLGTLLTPGPWLDLTPPQTCLVLDGIGHLYVGNSGVARMSTTGTGATDLTWQPAFDSAVSTCALAQGGGVYVGGAFLNAGGVRHFGFAKVSSSGVVSASTPDAEAPGQGYALAPLADGSMIVGGNFLKAGHAARKNIARMKADGTLDTTWNAPADQTVLVSRSRRCRQRLCRRRVRQHRWPGARRCCQVVRDRRGHRRRYLESIGGSRQ